MTQPAPIKHLADKLRAALIHARAQAAQGALFDRVAQGVNLPPDEFGAAVESLLGTPFFDRSALLPLTPDFSALSFTDCLQRQLLIAQVSDGGWVCCSEDPWRTADISLISQKLGAVPQVYWARGADITWALQRHADTVKTVSTFSTLDTVSDEDTGPVISLESIERTINPVVGFVDAAILDGWKSGASDIHLETGRSAILVKYRLDGVLVEVGRFDDPRRIEEVLNRVKVISGLDISEQRVPQDGRFRARLKDRQVDFRVSIMPSIHGEDAVIRVLDKSHLEHTRSGINLEALGFAPEIRGLIRRIAEEPHGMLLVTGPTGSGKTTTLYAVLSETRSGLEKIITIEDPVEYELPGILQIPVNEKKGLSFSRGLRSILRHDPDRLLVGEIRDSETAEIAVQAALTGHSVLTTVHANNGFDAVNRFLHMGVDLHAFAAAVNGIISQRLMRRVCADCAQPAVLSEVFVRQLQDAGFMEIPDTIRVGEGCAACRMTGYRGRFAVSEVLAVNDDFRQLIIGRAPIQEMKIAATACGMHSLRDRAFQAVLDGQTTEEEFRRVVAAQ